MIWAKAHKKPFYHRPRIALMAIYTVTLCLLSLTAFAQTANHYRITMAEAEQLIAEELIRKGVGEDIQASVIGRRSQEIIQRDEPVIMELAELEAESNNRFSATLIFTTEATLNHPAQQLGRLTLVGRYEEMVEVPMVKYRLSAGDVIREADVEWQKMPLNRTKRETILDMVQLVGKSPVRGLSPGRAIKQDEVQSPPIVMRRSPVRMSYTTENISIQAVGTAMQDGAMGDKIKVRNNDSGVEVDALVVDRGRVEIIPAVAFN